MYISVSLLCLLACFLCNYQLPLDTRTKDNMYFVGKLILTSLPIMIPTTYYFSHTEFFVEYIILGVICGGLCGVFGVCLSMYAFDSMSFETFMRYAPAFFLAGIAVMTEILLLSAHTSDFIDKVLTV